MKSERELQEGYYTHTAADYDAMHRIEGSEHALAARYIAAFCAQYGLRSVVDVGCGTGTAVRFFKDQGLEAKGVEPVQALIDIGMRERDLSSGELILGRAEQLPFEGASIDAVCEFAVLHHIKDPAPAVREMIRVARHAVFLSDENRFGRGSWLWRMIKLLWWKLGVFPLGFWLMTRGKGYNYTPGDGVSYSYSVFDSYVELVEWADVIFYIPLKKSSGPSWAHPLLSSSHILLCAFKHPQSHAG